MASGKSELGKGGMISKINAAKLVMEAGAKMVIANHSAENVLLKLLRAKIWGLFLLVNLTI